MNGRVIAIAVMLGIALGTSGVISGEIEEQRRWLDYKDAYNCHRVPNTSVDHDKTAWLCDDGVTYYR